MNETIIGSIEATAIAMELVYSCLWLATRTSVFVIAKATGINSDTVHTLMMDLETLGRVRRCADCAWECVE